MELNNEPITAAEIQELLDLNHALGVMVVNLLLETGRSSIEVDAEAPLAADCRVVALDQEETGVMNIYRLKRLKLEILANVNLDLVSKLHARPQ